MQIYLELAEGKSLMSWFWWRNVCPMAHSYGGGGGGNDLESLDHCGVEMAVPSFAPNVAKAESKETLAVARGGDLRRRRAKIHCWPWVRSQAQEFESPHRNQWHRRYDYPNMRLQSPYFE